MLLYWKTEKGKKYYFFSNFVLEDWKTRKQQKQKTKKWAHERERESEAKKNKKLFCKKSYRFQSTYFQFWIKKKTLFLLGPSIGKNEIYEPNF